MEFTIADCVAANALAFPDRVALELIDPASGGTTPVQCWTFSQAWERSCALAEALSGQERVAILLPNEADHVLAYIACQIAGAAAVPVNSRLAAAEIDYVLSDSGATVLPTASPLPFRV